MSWFGILIAEYAEGKWLTGVGPGAYERKWYANVLVENGVIAKVK